MSLRVTVDYKLINKYYKSLSDVDIEILKHLYPNYNINNLNTF